MERPGLLGVMVLMCLLSICHGRGLWIMHGDSILHEDSNDIYNHTLAKILVEHASAVYMTDLTALVTWTCSRCNDMIKEFEIVELVVDVQNCLQAYVGVSDNLNAIIIAIRGTQENSIQNWIQDLLWKQLDLDYPGMPDAMVHSGLYSAYHNTSLRPVIISAVHKIRKLYGDIGIMVTGHSMGGAMASFCALDLTVNYGMKNVQLMTFGQPRVGNAAFASYLNKSVPKTVRVVNNRDIVSHLPPYYSLFPHKTYHHFPREVWLHNTGSGSEQSIIEQICDGSGEDPACSRSVWRTSISDHRQYYGIDMESDTWSDCRIIYKNSDFDYRVDSAGNIYFSRDLLIAPTMRPSAKAEQM